MPQDNNSYRDPILDQYTATTTTTTATPSTITSGSSVSVTTWNSSPTPSVVWVTNPLPSSMWGTEDQPIYDSGGCSYSSSYNVRTEVHQPPRESGQKPWQHESFFQVGEWGFRPPRVEDPRFLIFLERGSRYHSGPMSPRWEGVGEVLVGRTRDGLQRFDFNGQYITSSMAFLALIRPGLECRIREKFLGQSSANVRAKTKLTIQFPTEENGTKELILHWSDGRIHAKGKLTTHLRVLIDELRRLGDGIREELTYVSLEEEFFRRTKDAQ